MPIDSLTARWRGGRTTLGAWVMLRDPLIAEAAATAGYDYVGLDLQHGLEDMAGALAMIQAMARTPAVPIVRVPWNEAGIVGRVLDAGALGIIVPMVNTPEEAARAVAACRYAPAGTRSVGPVRPGIAYGQSYVAEANDAIACIPMIETKEAIARIDEIISVPGVDAVYVGPADLSLTYGLPPLLDNADDVFESALTAVLDACERHGVVPGIHATAALAAKRLAAGFRMVTVASDVGAVMGGLRRDLATARAAPEQRDAP